jgi:mono/diheme cytochrome c family protein
VLGAAWFAAQGVSSRPQPPAFEARLARTARHLLIPRAARARANPLAPSAEVLTSARRHFADHCASCHGNDGHGQTEMGRNLYPKAPDMTATGTQGLSDGELFWIIENGVKLTGMPAWGAGEARGAVAAEESWGLVHFVRHLPSLSPAEMDEMRQFNPISPAELQEMEDEKNFLAGGDSPLAKQHEDRR